MATILPDKPRLAFFISTLGTGGIGKMHLLLTRGLAERGYPVDLLVGKCEGPFISHVDPRVRVLRMGTSHPLKSLPGLALYLRRARPAVLVTDKPRVHVAAVRARALCGCPTRLFTGVHGHASIDVGENGAERTRKQRAKFRAMQRYYPRSDGIIAVSQGVGQDLLHLLGVEERRLSVIYNPVVSPEIFLQAKEPFEHPWFAPGAPPVLLGIGRLEPQKDFPTLVRAFAWLRKRRECRLVILGEGSQRGRLEIMVNELGIADSVLMPGFVDNPYRWLARADLFVLSSVMEGLGNVLVEALALGVPSVSTRCPSGPDEILQQGRLGPLVPVGDCVALGEAMQGALDLPPSSDLLRQSVSSFTLEAAVNGYLRLFCC